MKGKDFPTMGVETRVWRGKTEESMLYRHHFYLGNEKSLSYLQTAAYNPPPTKSLLTRWVQVQKQPIQLLLALWPLVTMTPSFPVCKMRRYCFLIYILRSLLKRNTSYILRCSVDINHYSFPLLFDSEELQLMTDWQLNQNVKRKPYQPR